MPPRRSSGRGSTTSSKYPSTAAGSKKRQALLVQRPSVPEAIEVLRGYWELEACFHILQTFRRFFEFNPLRFSIDEFESCLCDHESLLLADIHCRALCCLLQREDVIITTWPQELWMVIQSRCKEWPEVQDFNNVDESEEGGGGSDSLTCPLYETLDVGFRLRMLHVLTDLLITECDALNEFSQKQIPEDELRLNVIGQDSAECSLFYFPLSMRICKEWPLKTVKLAKGKKKLPVSVLGREGIIDDYGDRFASKWELMAVSSSEFEALGVYYKKSTNALEKKLHRVLANNIVPDVISKLQSVERQMERKAMWEAMPRKRSGRLLAMEAHAQETVRERAIREQEDKVRRLHQEAERREREETELEQRRLNRNKETAERVVREARDKAQRMEEERRRRAEMREQRLAQREIDDKYETDKKQRLEAQRAARMNKRKLQAEGLLVDNSGKITVKLSSLTQEELALRKKPYLFSSQLAVAGANAVMMGRAKSLKHYYDIMSGNRKLAARPFLPKLEKVNVNGEIVGPKKRKRLSDGEKSTATPSKKKFNKDSKNMTSTAVITGAGGSVERKKHKKDLVDTVDFTVTRTAAALSCIDGRDITKLKEKKPRHSKKNPLVEKHHHDYDDPYADGLYVAPSGGEYEEYESGSDEFCAKKRKQRHLDVEMEFDDYDGTDETTTESEPNAVPLTPPRIHIKLKRPPLPPAVSYVDASNSFAGNASPPVGNGSSAPGYTSFVKSPSFTGYAAAGHYYTPPATTNTAISKADDMDQDGMSNLMLLMETATAAKESADAADAAAAANVPQNVGLLQQQWTPTGSSTTVPSTGSTLSCDNKSPARNPIHVSGMGMVFSLLQEHEVASPSKQTDRPKSENVADDQAMRTQKLLSMRPPISNWSKH